MLSIVRHTWKRFEMGQSGDLVIIALSGGADSTCLLDALDRLKDDFGIRLAVAHFDHGIRGEAGRRDAEFARSLAKKRSLRFILGHGDVPALARREKLSIEEAARQARYEFFESLPAKFGGVNKEVVKVALGHNADDQAETVVMRLIRGSGPRGLGGIPPVRNRYIRPLIEASREEIMEYLRARKLSWVEDETNVSGNYLRNRVRRELMPALKEYNPNLTETLARTAYACREMTNLLDDEALKMLEQCRAGKNEIFIPRKLLRDKPPALAMALIEAAINSVKGTLWAVRSDHRRAILDAAQASGTGRIVLPGGIEADIGREVRLGVPLSPVEDFCVPLKVPGTTRVEALGITLEASLIMLGKAKNLEADNLDDVLYFSQNNVDEQSDYFAPNVAYLDMDILSEPIEVRNFRRGDRIQPIGMSGTRKLQDLFVDLKVPRELRRRIPVITTGGLIAWVAPFRMAHSFRITDKTRRVLRIVLKDYPDFPSDTNI